MTVITQEDLMLVLQQSAAPQTVKIKIEVLNSDKKILGTLYGVVSGNVSINGEADIRRTANLVVQPTLTEKIKLTENSLLWLNKDIRMFVGLYNIRTKQYKYYPLGTYVYTNTSGTYNAISNQLSISCADFMKKLDGTKNGQLGAFMIKFPAYEENEDTGEIIKYNTIRNAVIEVLEKLAKITNYRIDDIGEYKALPDYNEDWETYREENEAWNAIPADQEFSSGCSVLSVLSAFRDLYPNYEMFFDIEDNAFTCQLKPMCYDDDVFLDYNFIRKILISENTSVEMTSVRNVCEVWGQVIEADFYTEICAYSDNIYSCSIAGYDKDYFNGDVIALKIPDINQKEAKLRINQLEPILIYNENNEEPITAGQLKANLVYSFRIKKKRINKQDVIKAYLLGQWQVHAINVLTDGKKSMETVTDSEGNEYERYSEEYFRKFYNCEQVEMTIVANSPFTVQKLGEILDVKAGGEYDNITSDDLALGRAKWENWKNCRLTDNITITTALLPFLDVNKKLTYKPSDSDYEHQYIITSVSHDFTAFTSTITMYRFYPMYETLLKEAGTHKALSEHSHGILSKYTHEQLTTIISGEEL